MGYFDRGLPGLAPNSPSEVCLDNGRMDIRSGESCGDETVHMRSPLGDIAALNGTGKSSISRLD